MRPNALLVVVPLLAGAVGVLGAPAPALADAVHDSTSTAQVFFTHASTCTTSGLGDATPAPTPVAADGLPHTASASSTLSAAGTSDHTDASSVVSSVVTATQTAGVLAHVDLIAQGSVSVVPSAGEAQTCAVSARALASSELKFDLPTARVATLTLSGAASRVDPTSLTGQLLLSGTSGGVNLSIALGARSATSAVVLPAGSWTLDTSTFVDLESPAPGYPEPTQLTGSSHATVDLQPVGAAAAAATGDASKYVTLGAARDCAAGTLAATWGKKAGKGSHAKVKKASFTVGGAKVLTVKKPHKGQVTTVGGLPSGAVEVAVTLQLAKRPGAHGKPPRLVLTRDYLPCS